MTTRGPGARKTRNRRKPGGNSHRPTATQPSTLRAYWPAEVISPHHRPITRRKKNCSADENSPGPCLGPDCGAHFGLARPSQLRNAVGRLRLGLGAPPHAEGRKKTTRAWNPLRLFELEHKVLLQPRRPGPAPAVIKTHPGGGRRGREPVPPNGAQRHPRPEGVRPRLLTAAPVIGPGSRKQGNGHRRIPRRP